jgi:hypothetical protein
MGDELIPISDEQAKLLQEALKAFRDLGGYFGGILGDLPKDIVGLLAGDWVKVRRAENLTVTLGKARERLRLREVKEVNEANLTVLLPIFEAASSEGRTELQEIWARLLAAAMDPSRRSLVRRDFVDIVKQMEPLDAVVIEKLYQWTGNATISNPTAQLASELGCHNGRN